MNDEPVFSPSEFVAGFNLLIEYNLPSVLIDGEISEFRISKDRWVYFKIIDEESSLSCFGTVYQLNLPIEDGMKVRLRASPRLHPKFNFSLNVITLSPIGEGNIKRASEILFKKLQTEGLFLPERKRALPFAPDRVGLITSKNSSAYSDFVKILDERWSGVSLLLSDVQVQGEPSAEQIVNAINQQNQAEYPAQVIVITRGGGSAEDLLAFNDERVVRAVALSRLPTLVAIGHEDNISLAEMAADMRASTPSNAVQLLVPDKIAVSKDLIRQRKFLKNKMLTMLETEIESLALYRTNISKLVRQLLASKQEKLNNLKTLLQSLNPDAILKRGYALLSINGQPIKKVTQVKPTQLITARLYDGTITANVKSIKAKQL
jgi:exodeoxyribonuclease VII large subunit